MAFRRSRRSKRSTKPRRSRASRRTRMYKSTRARSSFKSIGLPQTLSVKFPWFQLRQINPQAQYRHVILGNSVDPMPVGLQGLVSVSPLSAVNINDSLLASLGQYSDLYGSTNVTFSSWKIRVQNNLQRTETVGTDVVVTYGTCRVVCLVCPYQDPNYQDITLKNDLIRRVTELDAMSFTQCCAQPYAKVFNLNGQNSGHETYTFKISRRTKTMLGVSKIKDRIGFSGQDIPVTVGDPQPQEGWFIYMRQESTEAWDPPGALEYDIKGTVYCTLTNRAPIDLTSPTST